MNIPLPLPLPRVTPARVINCLVNGKDHLASDRRVAAAMVEAHPAQAALVRTAARATAEHVQALADEGLHQYLVLGCGLPRPDTPPLHDLAPDGATVFYLDTDLQAVVTTRAHYSHLTHVTVLDTDLAGPVLEDQALALDPNQPVAVVADLVLHHLTDTDLTDLARHLAHRLAPGSRLVLTHPTGHGAVAAGLAYTAAVLDEGVHDRYLPRGRHHLDTLLQGWHLDSTDETQHDLLVVQARLP